MKGTGFLRHATKAGRAAVLMALSVGLVIAAVFGSITPASAHTDFESSTPVDDEVTPQPVAVVTITFTAPSIVAGDGFQVLFPDGQILSPEVRISEDARTFTLLFSPPLTNGTYGVRWSVRAGDAHPIDGSFSFTTTAAGPPEATVIASPDEPDDPNAFDEPEPGQSAPVDEIPAAPTESQGTPEVDETVLTVPEATRLDAFLAPDTQEETGGRIQTVGRAGSLAGSLVAIGVVVFLALAFHGGPATRSLIRILAGLAAVATIAGAAVEAVGLVISLDGLAEMARSSAGLAVALRAVGAVGLVTAMVTRSRRVATPVAWVFAAVIAVSYLFDGHTVTEGNRMLTAAADLTHVVAGATWFGGLVALLVMAWSKDPDRRRDFVTSVVQFSVVATVALAGAGLAGLALTITILDSFSELWSTPWGRLLSGKVFVVGIAAAAGAFNHFVLAPRLKTSTADSSARAQTVRTLWIEVALLVIVVALTAGLVGAST